MLHINGAIETGTNAIGFINQMLANYPRGARQNIGFLIPYADISTPTESSLWETTAMLARGFEALDCSVAIEYEPQMANLCRVSERITHWLVMAGIGPDRFYVEDNEEDGFEFGFRIDYCYEQDFADVGQDFWKFVSKLVPLREPLRSEIHSAGFDPMNTICPGPNDFLLMIQPDLASDRYEFPPQEFWTKRCDAERAERESRSAKSPIKLIASNGNRLDSPS